MSGSGSGAIPCPVVAAVSGSACGSWFPSMSPEEAALVVVVCGWVFFTGKKEQVLAMQGLWV